MLDASDSLQKIRILDMEEKDPNTAKTIGKEKKAV
jgi:hypothetical protein